MNYQEAKARSDQLFEAAQDAGRLLAAYPRNDMGLVSDSVRLSPEYQAHKKASDKAFAEMRKFNALYVKAFKAEIRADRNAKYPAVIF